MNAPHDHDKAVRLTSLLHGGGCGCKIATKLNQPGMALAEHRMCTR